MKLYRKRRSMTLTRFGPISLWQCELFWIGMNELGLLNKENWKCELFIAGLKEMGLAA